MPPRLPTRIGVLSFAGFRARRELVRPRQSGWLGFTSSWLPVIRRAGMQDRPNARLDKDSPAAEVARRVGRERLGARRSHDDCCRCASCAGSSRHHAIATPSPAPCLHIDIQVHIDPAATAEQIDQIFASMARHLYDRG